MTAAPIAISRADTRRLGFPLSAIQQRLIGGLFILHGLAHAALGIWAAETGRWWVVASLWELAMVGFIAAGLGALGIAGLRELWRGLTLVAGAASILLFLTAPHRAFLPGLTVDVVALALISYTGSAASPSRQKVTPKHRVRRISGIVVSLLLVVYVALVLAIRPWNVQWGTTAAERAMVLPGDQMVPVAHYRIDHGITVNAPASSVWPWVIQLGQDRAGFYSYTKLENAVGARITNADRIVPAWQTRRVGELVPTVPADYLGGRFGKIGCKVLEVIPGRALVLEGWGAFVVVAASDSSARMLVRTRLGGEPDFGAVITRPFRLLVYEPAHLIMERRMLIGIKERAEASGDKTFLAGE